MFHPVFFAKLVNTFTHLRGSDKLIIDFMHAMLTFEFSVHNVKVLLVLPPSD